MQTISNEQQPAVRLLHQEFLQASLTKQGAFMSTYLHPQFLFTSPRAVVLDKEGYTRDLVLNPEVHLELFEITENEQVAVCGTTAVLTGTGKAKFRDKEAFLVRITTTLVYEGTQWKVLAMQETFIP